MQVYTGLIDQKIMGINVSAEMTHEEYLDFARDVIKNNDLQRSQVRSEGKPYELLRRDLAEGCVIPPIILAVSEDADGNLKKIVSEVIVSNSVNAHLEKIELEIKRAITEHRILILDGLQRTHTMLGVLADLSAPMRKSELDRFLSRSLRFEIYLGLSKQGILYRMLTLNTGQTPMSFRHQLEILYHDYLEGRNLPGGIEIVREVDQSRARGISKYKFSDVVELFYAFSTGNPLPYDKQALISSLREMSFLESYQFSADKDSMSELLECYNKFLLHISDKANNWSFDPDHAPKISRPFGANVAAIFSKTQPMAAFGAECESLLRKGVYSSISEISEIIERLNFQENPHASLDQLIMILNQIGGKAKKIGDAQRYYFQLAFRELLLPEATNHFDLSNAWAGAQEKYEMLYT
ncbi:hypothetical protein [Thioclava kandeliae]|uniref:DUF262 domain-containing protein n=1 Tax=Thioclava kandeliae TaxID=3070818 RepID=A0ABV1SCL7_9RHOB